MFDRLIWQPDRMLLDDLVFRLEQRESDSWKGSDHFRFYKLKGLVDQYEHFFRRRSDFHPANILELGIWDGGSVAFWHELFRPKKHVAIDLMGRSDSAYFERYVASRGLSDRIQTLWSFDQADKARLGRLLATTFDGPVNLVIDDASHLYGPTLASLEALFPVLSPGGLYIIEDWAWAHWRQFAAPDHPWAHEMPLTKLVFEAIEAAGTSTGLIASVTAYQGFVAIERGTQQVDDPASFSLDRQILRRSSVERSPSWRAAKDVLARLVRRISA